MGCPTMLIVGWADGYRNNSFRVVEQYQRNGLPWRLLAGPWVHKSPSDAAARTRTSNDDVEVLAFFGEHLRDDPPSAAARGPGVRPRADGARARPRAASRPMGRVRRVGAPRADRVALRPLRHRRAGRPRRRRRRRVELVRRRAPVGPAARPAQRQRPVDRARLADRRDVPPARRPSWSAIARARFRVRTDRHVRARQHQALRRVPRRHLGADHARHARPHAPRVLAGRRPWCRGRSPRPLTPGGWIDVDLAFEATTWTLAARARAPARDRGHRLAELLAAAGPVTLEVDAATVELELPLTASLAASDPRVRARASGPSADEADGVVWRIEHDVTRTARRAWRPATAAPTTGCTARSTTDDYRGELGVSTTEPGRTRGRVGTSSYRMTWPEATVRTEATLAVVSDERRVRRHHRAARLGRRPADRRAPMDAPAPTLSHT